MEIRKAIPGDIPAVAALESACFSEPWPESMIGRMLEEITVAGDGGALAGYAVLSSVLDEGSLDSIAVAPEARRRGIADALLCEILRQAREKELAFVTLEVRESNAAGIALYRKHGFEEVGRRKGYYEKPREDAILMTLVLKEC